MKKTDIFLAYTSVCGEIESAGLPPDRLRLLDEYKEKISRRIAADVYRVTDEEEILCVTRNMDISAELRDLKDPPLDLVLTIADFIKLWNAVRI